MVFLRRICSSRPGDGEQRGQSLAALTARGRGLDCFQPQPRQPVLRRNKLRIFRFRASAKAQSLRLFLLSPRSRLLRGDPIYSPTLCVQADWAAHGAFLARPSWGPHKAGRLCEERRSSVVIELSCLHGSERYAACFDEVVARAVRVSQPAVLSALLVIQLFGIVIPPPYFLLRAPKGALRPFLGRSAPSLLFHGALRNILLSAEFPTAVP